MGANRLCAVAAASAVLSLSITIFIFIIINEYTFFVIANISALLKKYHEANLINK